MPVGIKAVSIVHKDAVPPMSEMFLNFDFTSYLPSACDPTLIAMNNLCLNLPKEEHGL